MPQAFDSTVVRAWIALALEAVAEGREEIDAINVFPVADGDTGTNLQRTLEAAGRALDEAEWDAGSARSAAPALRALARGALLGACGNSGTILAQLLRGMAGVYAAAEGGEAEDAEAELAEAADARVAGGREGRVPGGGRLLADALGGAAEAAYEAVAHPVEGTMLSVARAAAEAAHRAAGDAGHAAGHAGEAGQADGAGQADQAVVARAAHERSREALAETTGQLDVLRRAGVVDAGGRGLVAVLGALADALGNPEQPPARPGAQPLPGRTEGSGGRPEARGGSPASGAPDSSPDGGAYEVMYLLDADDAAVGALRERLDALGDSLVVGGGDGLWSVHVHADDAGAAVEEGLAAGRPHRIRITHLSRGRAGGPCAAGRNGAAAHAHADAAAQSEAEAAAPGWGTAPDRASAPARAAEPERADPAGRAVVAVVPGAGLVALCEEAGARVVRAEEVLAGLHCPAADGATAGPLGAAVTSCSAAEVVLLPGDAELHDAASRAAGAAGEDGRRLRAAVVPTRAAVQGLAALAVHDPERPFEDDVSAMTAAADAVRYGHVTLAEDSLAAADSADGRVLGLVADEVVVTGGDVAEVAAGVLERMLAEGGELVTLIEGAQAPTGLAERLAEQARGDRPGVEAAAYAGGQDSPLLMIGVE